MNYYKFHLGDYHKSTAHLTPMEDLAYRRLLDLYYDREKPLPLDVDNLVRLIRMNDYKKETQQILSEFFEKTQRGWIQKRVAKELKAYTGKAATARENGKKGGRPKKTQSVISGNPDESKSKANHKPITNNHKPITIPKEINADAWGEYEQHRVEIRKPLSDLARMKAMKSIKHLDFEEQAKIIDRTIQNRWTGLFPDQKAEPKSSFGSAAI